MYALGLQKNGYTDALFIDDLLLVAITYGLVGPLLRLSDQAAMPAMAPTTARPPTSAPDASKYGPSS